MFSIAILSALVVYLGLLSIPIIRDRTHWKYQLKSAVNSVFRLSWLIWVMCLIIMSTVAIDGFDSWREANSDIFHPYSWIVGLMKISIVATPLIITALTVSRVQFEGVWKFTKEEKDYSKEKMKEDKVKIKRFLHLNSEVK